MVDVWVLHFGVAGALLAAPEDPLSSIERCDAQVRCGIVAICEALLRLIGADEVVS